MSHQILIKVLYFGIAQELLGKKEELYQVNQGTTVKELTQLVYAQSKALEDLAMHFRWAVNQSFCDQEDLPLKEGDQVALIPPMSGG